MMPFHSWSVPGRKPGTSTNVSTGTLNASHVRTKRAAFSMRRCPACRRAATAGSPRRRRRPSTRPKPHEDVRREQRLHLEELAVVEHVLDDRVHVVRLVRRVGHERVELTVVVGDLERGRVVVRGGSSRLLLGRYDSRRRT
jgi:hypothetical protein